MRAVEDKREFRDAMAEYAPLQVPKEKLNPGKKKGGKRRLSEVSKRGGSIEAAVLKKSIKGLNKKIRLSH